MQSIISPALVVKTTGYGESHRIVFLATPGKGLVHAVARHARKSLRRFPGALDYFKLIEVSLTRKSGGDDLWQLNRAKIVHYYKELVIKYKRYLAACWAIENYRVFVPRDLADPLCFDWLKDNFDYFESREPDAASVFTSFVNLLRITGNLPSFDRCVICGRKAPEGRSAYFDPRAGGILCRKCGGKKNLLPAGLRRFLIPAAGTRSLTGLDDFPAELKNEAAGKKSLLLDLMDGLSSILTDRRSFSGDLLFRAL